MTSIDVRVFPRRLEVKDQVAPILEDQLAPVVQEVSSRHGVIFWLGVLLSALFVPPPRTGDPEVDARIEELYLSSLDGID